MLRMLKKINIYELYDNDEYICSIRDEKKLKEFTEYYPQFLVKEVECYTDLNSKYCDEDTAYEYSVSKTVLNINGKTYEVRTEGTPGYCAIVTYLLLSKENLWDDSLTFEIIESEYILNYLDEDIKRYYSNVLINQLLLKLDSINFKIVQYLIDYILDHKIENIEDLPGSEVGYYNDEDFEEKIVGDMLENCGPVLFYDICIYDVLNLNGMQLYDHLKRLYNKSNIRDKIKYFIIIEIFKNFDVHFAYQAYKMVINGETPVITELKLQNSYY